MWRLHQCSERRGNHGIDLNDMRCIWLQLGSLCAGLGRGAALRCVVFFKAMAARLYEGRRCCTQGRMVCRACMLLGCEPPAKRHRMYADGPGWLEALSDVADYKPRYDYARKECSGADPFADTPEVESSVVRVRAHRLSGDGALLLAALSCGRRWSG